MVGIVRKGSTRPDRRLPPPPVEPIDRCVRCGELVTKDERLEGIEIRHLICDPSTRRALARQLEASRAIHRVLSAITSIPILAERLEAAIADLPDAGDAGAALAFTAHARVVVECSSELSGEQRRMALSYLDAATRSLSA